MASSIAFASRTGGLDGVVVHDHAVLQRCLARELGQLRRHAVGVGGVGCSGGGGDASAMTHERLRYFSANSSDCNVSTRLAVRARAFSQLSHCVATKSTTG
jgi:hypothetical protein